MEVTRYIDDEKSAVCLCNDSPDDNNNNNKVSSSQPAAAVSSYSNKRYDDNEKPRRGLVRAPTIAGAKVKLLSGRFNGGTVVDLDVVSRDPNHMNRHCQVKFEDIIAEPDPDVFSFDGVWTLSYKVFTSTKLWCYRITSLICAVPAAVCWGIEFACLSFCTIWCWQPSLKAYEISLWYTRRIFEIVLGVFFEPCFHAMGRCFSHIVVTIKREA